MCNVDNCRKIRLSVSSMYQMNSIFDVTAVMNKTKIATKRCHANIRYLCHIAHSTLQG